jgi:hypothetical protein
MMAATPEQIAAAAPLPRREVAEHLRRLLVDGAADRRGGGRP